MLDLGAGAAPGVEGLMDGLLHLERGCMSLVQSIVHTEVEASMSMGCASSATASSIVRTLASPPASPSLNVLLSSCKPICVDSPVSPVDAYVAVYRTVCVLGLDRQAVSATPSTPEADLAVVRAMFAESASV
ncbi:hypothetical protein KIPB_013960 [Kipferlia bialata]|uniref:Uncharacterized protein n=1 Tax=Kipferlia bialata TaxID=797122 RepID=A0A9K3D842_9EUKA|nr:hypothetical protein KIPB_013960 [Kipferlia bialata]|eukprot:g13960.t1